MRRRHWKLLPGFLLGLVVVQAVGWGVGTAFGAYAGLRKLHWAIWLILSLVFPFLALVIHGRAEQIPGLYPVGYLVNAAGAGWAYGIVLGFWEVPLEGAFGTMLTSAVLPAMMAVSLCLLYTVWRRTRWIAIGFTLLTFAAIFGCLIFGEGRGMLALGGIFGLLFFASMPISCGKVLCGEDWLEQLALSGFGAYLIVVLGAMVFLLEDGLDGGFDGLFEGIADVASGLDTPPQQKRR